MIRKAILCDFCDHPIPEKIDENGYRYVSMNRTKEWETSKLFPCLCERCATKLDRAFKDLKDGMVKREETLIKYKQVNDERRKRLGTEG